MLQQIELLPAIPSAAFFISLERVVAVFGISTTLGRNRGGVEIKQAAVRLELPGRAGV